MSQAQHFKKPAGKLKIIVRQAKNLYDTQTLGKQDPFVVIYVQGGKKKSAKAKTGVHNDGGRNPTWNKELNFHLFGDETTVKFQVMNSNIVSDAEIGSCEMLIQEVPLNLGSKWYTITRGKNAVAGEVEIYMELNGEGEPKKEQQAPSPASSTAAHPAATGAYHPPANSSPASSTHSSTPTPVVHPNPNPTPVAAYGSHPQQPQQPVYASHPQSSPSPYGVPPQQVYQQTPQPVVYQQHPQQYQPQPQVVYQGQGQPQQGYAPAYNQAPQYVPAHPQQPQQYAQQPYAPNQPTYGQPHPNQQQYRHP